MARMFLNEDVLAAARRRVRRLFREFDDVVVSFSGGKDSTVTLHLALEAAAELSRPPVKVLWIDQEAEWDCVVRYVRSVMARPDVEPHWFQGPFRLFNATASGPDPWLHCWQEGREADWIRPKEPGSVHANETGEDRFKGLFAAYCRTYFGDRSVAQLGGVRCEESPGRMNGLTAYATWKDVTWGSMSDRKRGHYVFYPIYDWCYVDVWKYIHDNGLDYCELYDWQYRYGVPVRDMRVSNVHHETAVANLRFLQEVEPETWDRVTARLGATHAAGRVPEAYRCPAELPFMFGTWREYRDYLLEELILDGEARERFRVMFANWDRTFRVEDPRVDEDVVKLGISSLLVNDFEGTKYSTFMVTHARDARAHGVRRGELG